MPAMFRSLLALALLALAAQGYDFVRYSNPASAALAEADRLYQQAAPLQAAAVSSVPAGQVGVLLQQHLSAGFALPGDWFTNADGSVVVLLSEPGCGAIIRQFTVYHLREGYYRYTGTYRMLTRACRWLPGQTRFDTLGQGGMTLVHESPRGGRSEHRFDFALPRQVHRLAPAHAPITPAEEKGLCPPRPIGR